MHRTIAATLLVCVSIGLTAYLVSELYVEWQTDEIMQQMENNDPSESLLQKTRATATAIRTGTIAVTPPEKANRVATLVAFGGSEVLAHRELLATYAARDRQRFIIGLFALGGEIAAIAILNRRVRWS